MARGVPGIARAINVLSHHDGEKTKLEIVRENIETTRRRLREAVDAGKPWAIQTVLECAGVIERRPEIKIAVFQSLGVKNEAEAQKLIEMAREAEGMTVDATIAMMEQQLVTYYAENPGARDQSPLRQVFGDSNAEVVE